jgi:hypothetical protein
MHWTHILTAKEKKHMHENVTVLTGMNCKSVTIGELKKSRGCLQCRLILEKLEGKKS